MLTRTFRLVDKLSLALLKSTTLLMEVILDGVSAVWGVVARLLTLLLRAVLFVLRPLGMLLLAVLGLLTGGARRSARAAARGGSTAMARRAARAQVEATVVEDPLRQQNRTLSGLVVLLLAALLGVVLWATGQGGATVTPLAGGILPPDDPDSAFAVTATNPVVPTAQPTFTPLPPALSARGAIAYTVRENGQTDLFAIPIGGRTPIRLTDDLADDRDPAWSPDGGRLAFASRRDGNWELYLLDVASGGVSRLTNDLAFQGSPSWSSDGQYLVYESYLGGSLNLYVMQLDGERQQIAVPGANSDAPDFSPAWSPDGRRIAFVSLREGNADIYVYSLDDQTVFNLTRTADRAENYPSWSPDSAWITYSALDAGQEKVFVTALDAPGTARVINLGSHPTWSPDGTSIAGVVESLEGAQIVVNPFTTAGTAAVLPAPARTTGITWTAQPLPAALVQSGGLPAPQAEPLFVETFDQAAGDPPYRLNAIPGVQVEQAVLSDRVNDSFNALRAAVNRQVGIDVLGRLDDAFWQIDRPPQPGVPRRGNWLLSGRAFSLARAGIFGFPPPLEVVREDIGVETFWRVFVRVNQDAQSGQLGEPLRSLAWDFAARTSGDVEAYDQGGRLKDEVARGYYVDLTELAADYGWMRAPAGRDWRANSETINFWLFEKRDGLDWLTAMRELYTEAQLGGFNPTPPPPAAATAIPAPTLEIRPSPIPVTAAPPPGDG
jgi:TolB protein